MKGNQKKCHSKPDLESHHKLLRNDEILNQVQDDEGRSGFTLIELLVVVLIIGILSAIAVPQYQKAVLKSRFSSLMPTTKSIRDGNEMYYMTNGRYADDIAKLDVTTANNADMALTLSDDMDYAYTMATRPNIKNNLIMYQKHSANFPGEIHCEALEGNTQAEWLCGTALHGTPLTSGSVTEGYNTYILEGSGSGLFGGADENTLTCDKAESMGLTCSITTNAQGQTVKKVCINGVCRTKTYDEDGGYTSVTCKVNSDRVCLSDWRFATYDANGNQTSTRSCSSVDSSGKCTAYKSSGNIDYTYDENGNMLTEWYCSSMDNDGTCTKYDFRRDYTYDENGNKISRRDCSSVDSNGKCTKYDFGYDYTYDENGKLKSSRYCESVDSRGRCTSYEVFNNYDHTYAEDGKMRFDWECSSVDSSGKCTEYIYRYDYTYDENSNMISERACGSYDSSGKCTAYSDLDNADYTYDANGNMTSRRYCSVDDNGKCTAYQSDGTYDYTYDDDGKQIASHYCSGSNINMDTGECIAYNSTQTFAN